MGNFSMKELNKHFQFPFQPHNFQVEAAKEMEGRACCLLRFNIGLGKTLTSTLSALNASLHEDVEQILILCPPILLDQWYAFLCQVKGIPDIIIYRGTPAERERMTMNESVILASYNIFRGKRDYKRFVKLGKQSKLCIIADEVSMKSLGTTYKRLKELLYRKLRLKAEDKPFHKFIALNATPLSGLEQVYNWTSLMTPGVYLSQRWFKVAHVLKEDHFGKVLVWHNEELMQENMDRFSVNTTTEIKLPPLIETVVPYTLSKEHLKLYREVEESELMNLPEDKIELALNSMFTTLQRLVLVPREFGLDIDSPVMEFINGYLDQLEPTDGVLIYSRHVMVSKILEASVPNCAAIYGGVSDAARKKAFQGLQSGELHRMVGNLESLGVGLNLQMLQHIIYCELPFRSDKLTQSSGRVHRQGQPKTCFANYPIATGTLQEKIYQRLLKNGEEINKVMKTRDQVREFLA